MKLASDFHPRLATLDNRLVTYFVRRGPSRSGMGTVTPRTMAISEGGSLAGSLAARTRKTLSRAGGLFGLSPAGVVPADGLPSATSSERVEPAAFTFRARIRKFVWLWSGLFSAASFAMPALGLLGVGRIEIEAIGTSFLAGVMSAGLFGLTSLLHFGPDTA